MIQIVDLKLDLENMLKIYHQGNTMSKKKQTLSNTEKLKRIHYYQIENTSVKRVPMYSHTIKLYTTMTQKSAIRYPV